MTVSIANMTQVWMSNTNTYNGIAMSVSTLGYGANVDSRLLNFIVDANTKFSVDANGVSFQKTFTVSTLPSAVTAGVGAKTFVTDASVTTFASIVSAGGSNKVPVYSDGTNWRIG
jgi:hypothetical protein